MVQTTLLLYNKYRGLHMKEMKTALVLGAGGFIGSWMVKRLKSEGYWVRGVDIKHPEFSRHEVPMNLLLEILEIKVLSTV